MAESSQSPHPEDQPPAASFSACPECLILCGCSHSFHRICIETCLASSSTCPTCKRTCEPSDLRGIQAVPLPPQGSRNTSKKSRGRGAISRSYNTRSTTRNLFQESQNPLLNISSGPNGDLMQTPSWINSDSNR